jgi:hypothetical protein
VKGDDARRNRTPSWIEAARTPSVDGVRPPLVVLAEGTRGEANPRFVVTSLSRDKAGVRHLYETIYCARARAATWKTV